EQTPLETLKDWETFHTADKAAPFPSPRFEESNFGFHHRDLLGATAMRPRQSLAICRVSFSLGDAVGQKIPCAILSACGEDANRINGDTAQERYGHSHPWRSMDERQHSS